MENNAMTPGMVKTYLREHGYRHVAGRISALIEAVGGCESFLTATVGQLEKAFNDAHPRKPGSTKAYGLGPGTLEVVDVARTFIRGVDDATRLDKRIAQERKEARENVEHECYKAAMSDLQSTLLDLECVQSAIAWLVQVAPQATLGEILSAYDKFAKKSQREAPK